MSEKPVVSENAALAETWRRYRGWAKRARALRAEIDRWRTAVLALTVAGTLLATVASQYPAWTGVEDTLAARVLSGLGAVAMALAAYLSRSILDPNLERQWLRARALAESCKSEAFRFAVGVKPYEGGDGRLLLARLQRLLAAGADIPAMEVDDRDAARGRPDYPLPIEAYATRRLREQIDTYYRPRAMENERKAVRYGAAMQAMGALAAVLAALGALTPGSLFEPWVAVVGAVSAAMASHALSQRFQRLASTYRVAADRLALRLALWRIDPAGPDDPASARALVRDAEAIIAAENEAWLADAVTDRATKSEDERDGAERPAPDPGGQARAPAIPAPGASNGAGSPPGEP